MFFSQFNSLFSCIKIKICRGFHFVFTSIVDAFPSCKDVQSAMGQGKKHGYNHGDILHMSNHLFFTLRVSKNHSNSIRVNFVGWQFFHTLQSLANQWLPKYHINIISSDNLSLDSVFLPAPASSLTLGLFALYTNTLGQVFEVK